MNYLDVIPSRSNPFGNQTAMTPIRFGFATEQATCSFREHRLIKRVRNSSFIHELLEILHISIPIFVLAISREEFVVG